MNRKVPSSGEKTKNRGQSQGIRYFREDKKRPILIRIKWWKHGSLWLLLLLLGCSTEPQETAVAFYHWQTRLELDDSERAMMQSLQVQRLYTKVFDLGWDARLNEPTPRANLELADSLQNVMLVPTIYITNEVMQRSATTTVDTLASRILQHTDQLLQQRTYDEIQIDCDWSESSRATYFTFLRALRQQLNPEVILSVTLRLHQYRYPQQTGIPPADRATLMFYNMGELTNWSTPNSILNLEAAKPYLQTNESYPLPLDLALPLFRWGVLFREGRMIKLLNGITPAQLEAVGAVAIHSDDSQRYRLTRDTYLTGYYLYENDLVRLEAVTPSQLEATQQLLQSQLDWRPRHLIYYHLDSALVADFTTQELTPY